MTDANELSRANGLTVGEVSRHLGVTVRALHHWDEMGLAPASLRTAAGYRLYTAEDLQRLHRVAAYREIGVGLEKIQRILDDSSTDVPAALRLQRAQIDDRIERLKQLSTGLERMITAHERGLVLSAEEQSSVFGPQWDPESAPEARDHYGDTTEWRQFAERSASRSSEDWRAIAEAVAAFERDLGVAIDSEVAAGSVEANELIERHRREFSAAYFPLTRQMQVCLGHMFESDPDYAAHYNSIRPGMSTWLRQSIDANARANGIDPDTATWQ